MLTHMGAVLDTVLSDGKSGGNVFSLVLQV